MSKDGHTLRRARPRASRLARCARSHLSMRATKGFHDAHTRPDLHPPHRLHIRHAGRPRVAAGARRPVGRGDPPGRRVRHLALLPDHARPVRVARSGRGRRGRACATASAISPRILANTPEDTRDPKKPWLLAPIDLQAVKAAGVTFAISLLERVIEEQARGAPERAAQARAEVESALGGAVEKIKPGSPQAMELKKLLQAKGLWSQYLEVGIGPDAEIFTKSPGDGRGRHRHVDRRARSPRPGTIPSPRSWWSPLRRAGSSARRSATT